MDKFMYILVGMALIAFGMNQWVQLVFTVIKMCTLHELEVEVGDEEDDEEEDDERED